MEIKVREGFGKELTLTTWQVSMTALKVLEILKYYLFFKNYFVFGIDRYRNI